MAATETIHEPLEVGADRRLRLYRIAPRAAELHEVVQMVRKAFVAVQQLEATPSLWARRDALGSVVSAWYVFGVYSLGLRERTRWRLIRILGRAADRLTAVLG